MRKSILLLAGCVAIAGGAVQARQLGGLGGAVGGQVGGGFGTGGLGSGLSGSLNSGVNGGLRGDAAGALSGRANPNVGAAARGATRRAVPPVTAPRLGASAAVVGGGAVPSAVIPALPTPVVPDIVVPPIPALGAADVQIIRERQRQAMISGGVVVLDAPQTNVYMDRQERILRRDLAGEGVEVRREGEAIILQMPGDVTFAFDKSEIRPRFYRVLDTVARTLNDYPATFVDVTGHTDAVGSDAYNQGLSERRAYAVADFIQERQRIPARLYVAGRGEHDPIASNTSESGRAANRRVEIELHPYVARD